MGHIQSRFPVFAVAGCLAVAGCVSEDAARHSGPSQELPSVGGFTLMDTWGAVGGAVMPCHQMAEPERRRRGLDSTRASELTVCEPSDSVSLFFLHDTLQWMTIELSDRPVRAQAYWRQSLPGVVQLLGMPDTTEFESGVDSSTVGFLLTVYDHETVAATWRVAPTRKWAANVLVMASKWTYYPLAIPATDWSASGNISVIGCGLMRGCDSSGHE